MFVIRRGCPCCGCSFDAISEKTKQGKVFFLSDSLVFNVTVTV